MSEIKERTIICTDQGCDWETHYATTHYFVDQILTGQEEMTLDNQTDQALTVTWHFVPGTANDLITDVVQLTITDSNQPAQTLVADASWSWLQHHPITATVSAQQRQTFLLTWAQPEFNYLWSQKLSAQNQRWAQYDWLIQIDRSAIDDDITDPDASQSTQPNQDDPAVSEPEATQSSSPVVSPTPTVTELSNQTCSESAPVTVITDCPTICPAASAWPEPTAVNSPRQWSADTPTPVATTAAMVVTEDTHSCAVTPQQVLGTQTKTGWGQINWWLLLLLLLVIWLWLYQLYAHHRHTQVADEHADK